MKGQRIPAGTVFRSPVHFLAFGFGSGLAPVAPGTVGTLVAVPAWLGIAMLPAWWQVGVVVAAMVVGIWLCGRSAGMLGVHDHGGIVWDEFVGLWLTMLLAPTAGLGGDWPWLLGGFLAFRLFDIAKPWPIKRLDRDVAGGLGIMLDDILAAVYAAALLRIVQYVLTIFQ